ncbi:MAG: hypothetical protein J5526_03100 [Bacteroidales bacterium]|nr:hypothetical protein [Bacteroidales bacterium]
MKRIIVALLLVAFTAGAAQAQVGVYRSGGAIKKEKKEHREKREREEQERERERLERELYEQQERERQKKLMQERLEAERVAKEKAEKRRQERLEAERVAKEKAEKRRQERREYRRNLEWTNSIVLNYSLTLLGGTSNVGLTYARCKFGGFYVNAMSGLEWHTANVDGTMDQYFVTNKKSHPRISFTVGGVIRVAKPVFAYAGAGYAYRGLNYKTADGNWVQYPKGEYNLGNCADLEIGLIGNIKGFTLQLGYSILLSESGHANEIKVGVGYSFGSKKQKQKQSQEQKQEEMEVIEDE